MARNVWLMETDGGKLQNPIIGDRPVNPKETKTKAKTNNMRV